MADFTSARLQDKLGSDRSGGEISLRLAGPQSIFKYQSGRVIALGRAMLASLFLLSVWLDPSQPANQPGQTYAILIFYVAFAIAVTAATWRNWWLDARLAAPAHVVDMAVFTAVVFSTNGYTSPFFLFFVLPLLSAAIRWGWRETALTATVLVILYMSAGLLVAGSQAFEEQRFVARSGHLVILSALLIWFGIHQRFSLLFYRLDELDARMTGEDDSLAEALRFAMQAGEATAGALLLRATPEAALAGLCISDAGVRATRTEAPLVKEPSVAVLLFDSGKDRLLTNRANGGFRFAPASGLLDLGELGELGAAEGLIAEVQTGTARGWLVLWGARDLSTDYLELGRELGRLVGSLLDRNALISAIETGAAARTRLSLARDVHDSLVQFLAGATFRVEAMMRGSRSGSGVESDLQELKRLLIEEQAEIRGFVSALRRDRELDLSESVQELRALAARLGRQWSIECTVQSSADEASVPIRLQLDLQQLLREAVANAVRHGGANHIAVDLRLADGALRMEVSDNGSGFVHTNGGAAVEPWSLKERVDRAHGSLRLVCQPGRTNIVINLPLSGAAA